MNKYIYTLLFGGIALSTFAESEEVSLEPIELTGEEAIEQLGAFEPSSNSKLLLPVNELPRSLNIVAAEEFTERGAINLQETSNYTTGVFSGAFGLDTRIDTFSVRGVDPQFFRDGFLSHYGFYNQARTEIYTLESVEVIKGPSSALYGQGALGGIINSNSKLPKADAAGEVNLQVGTNDRYQVGVDVTGPIDKEGKVLYRVVSLVRESGTEVEHVDDDAVVFMPSITWLPTDKTSLTLLANYQEHNTGSTLQFLPDLDSAPGVLAGPFGADILPPMNTLDIDLKEFVGEPNYDLFETDSLSFSAILEQELTDVFSLSANARHSESEANYRYMQPIGYSLAPPGTRFSVPTLDVLTDPGDVYRLGFESAPEIESFAANLVLKAKGTLFGLDHIAQLGVDYFDIQTEDERVRDPVLEALAGRLNGFYLSTSKINLLNPVYTGAPTVPTDLRDTRDAQLEQVGFYFSDVIKYDQWIGSFNLRYDDVEQSYKSPGVLPTDDTIDYSHGVGEFTFDAGIMYQFSNGISPYYSYAESFNSNDVLDPSTNKLVDPLYGSQHEVGVKYVSKDARTAITGCYFYIDEKNRIVGLDLLNSDPEVVDATYEGVEFGVSHRIEDFHITAHYTYLETDQKGESADGDKVSFVPDQMVNTWVTWRPSGMYENFRAGFGARYIGNTLSSTNVLETAGYTLFDMMLGYQFKNLDVQLNITNLTDKEAIVAYTDAGLGGGASSFEGPGRFVGITAVYSF